MKYFSYIFIYIILSVGLVGCGSSSGSKKDATNDDFVYLYEHLQDVYLWNDTLPKYFMSDFSQYETLQDLLDDLKYSQDKWSYIETKVEYFQRASQIDSGFGCKYTLKDDGLYIYETDFESPCDLEGLQRGDRVISIGDLAAEDFNYEEYDLIQKNVGEKVIFTVDRNGTIYNELIAPIVYTYKTVKSQILDNNSTKIGHMIYDSFTSASYDEINTTFTSFKDGNVTELILDLRYNGGGSLIIASALLDKIAGFGRENQKQYTLQHNANNTHENESGFFETDDNSLNLNRVFILTTDGSASASELVINALKPYITVVQIGTKTHGKPVGMTSHVKGDNIYWPITFEIVNANGVGGYFDGISPTCEIEDNIEYLRTDTNGSMLKEALHYISHGGCS